ncbi:DUF4870 domain-containing protein [Lentilactobacillus kisonensis]|uniref:DUF4870 domain-containing protein n=2 Tax=Lentilactobacillus kisonensis TaxID=481722 RepID=H1LD13_9LACO|nr:DUF4870 domain-containing protein [Lentilactobacillus kisonensis]EHO53621.1 hypothetical protein HMPREF9104_00477 [Lentilactobacillus kisonensis F0435]KRL20497.1 hypothetical protein FC98_GL001438 [Lentilactobacillus kisonensis DSM 19906 = JCM 15041]
MSENKVVNALSYLSIVFAPFIFPFIVWLVSKDNPDMHETAKRAFLLHLIPVVLSILTILLFTITFATSSGSKGVAVLFGIVVILVILIDILMFIYNLYLGIKILID